LDDTSLPLVAIFCTVHMRRINAAKSDVQSAEFDALVWNLELGSMLLTTSLMSRNSLSVC